MNKELLAIIKLYDDPDGVVHSAVQEKMVEGGYPLLENLKKHSKTYAGRHNVVLRMIKYLNSELILKDFTDMMYKKEYDLYLSVARISCLLNPELTMDEFYSYFYPSLQSIENDLTADKTAVEKVELFNLFFYNQIGMHAGNYPPQDEKTSELCHIIKHREGTPISISILYFLMARMLNINVYPVFFGGGFVAAYIDGDLEYQNVSFFIDIYKSGAIFHKNLLKQFMAKQDIEYKEDILKVRGDDAIIIIYLEILLYMYEMKGENEKYNYIKRAIESISEERFLSPPEEDNEENEEDE